MFNPSYASDWLARKVGKKVSDEMRILYCCGVTAKNCEDLAKCPDIDGFLVGGACLKPEFSQIINANTFLDSVGQFSG